MLICPQRSILARHCKYWISNLWHTSLSSDQQYTSNLQLIIIISFFKKKIKKKSVTVRFHWTIFNFLLKHALQIKCNVSHESIWILFWPISCSHSMLSFISSSSFACFFGGKLVRDFEVQVKTLFYLSMTKRNQLFIFDSFEPPIIPKFKFKFSYSLVIPYPPILMDSPRFGNYL